MEINFSSLNLRLVAAGNWEDMLDKVNHRFFLSWIYSFYEIHPAKKHDWKQQTTCWLKLDIVNPVLEPLQDQKGLCQY